MGAIKVFSALACKPGAEASGSSGLRYRLIGIKLGQAMRYDFIRGDTSSTLLKPDA
jgi:hypothetical protein